MIQLKVYMRWKNPVISWLNDLRHVFFPEVCPVCGRVLVEGEDTLCMECDALMPRTNFHLDSDNPLYYRLLSQHIPLDHAAAMFHYKTGNPYTRLITVTKYNDRPQLGFRMGAKYAAELLPTGFFTGVDILVPVPMHWWKQIRRGYNQATEIARGISKITGISVAGDALSASKHGTQTRRNAYQRLLNARKTYSVADIHAIAGKHIVLVDDVITTGATMVSICEAIRKQSPTTTISVVSLAHTYFQV